MGAQVGTGLIGPDDLDSQLLIRGIGLHIDRQDMPAQEFVLRFEFWGIPKGNRTPRHWWLMTRRQEDEIEVCRLESGSDSLSRSRPSYAPLQ